MQRAVPTTTTLQSTLPRHVQSIAFSEIGSVDEMFKCACDVAVSAAVSGVSAIAPNYRPQIMVFAPS